MKRNRSAQAVRVLGAYEIVCSKYPTYDAAKAVKASLQARVSCAGGAISSVDAPKPE